MRRIEVLSYDRIIIEIKKVFQLKDGHIFLRHWRILALLIKFLKIIIKENYQSVFNPFSNMVIIIRTSICADFSFREIQFKFCKQYSVVFKKGSRYNKTFKELIKDLLNF